MYDGWHATKEPPSNFKISTFVFSEFSTVQEKSTIEKVDYSSCGRQPNSAILSGYFKDCTKMIATVEYHYTKLQYHTFNPKIKAFPVTFEGTGLNCKSATQILLYVASVNDSLIRCNLWSDLLSNGVARCSYRCKCPEVCSVLEVYLDNRYTASICQIFV